MMTEQEIVSRYRKNYGLSDAIGAEHVEQHRALECELTKQLLNSTPANRWQVFDDCYTTLYRALPWLNTVVNEGPRSKDRFWPPLLKNNSTILEVGSGSGTLIRRLAALGHNCVATEITNERGKRHVENVEGLEWRSTDGINLAKFERAETYDYVISRQVIEHFHPDDIKAHFENVRIILKSGGEYIFVTPHVGTGPHDLSRVFGLERPSFMHLREYNFHDLGKIARSAGFRRIRANLYHPRINVGPISSELLFQYYSLVDNLICAARLSHGTERLVRRMLLFALVPGYIWLDVQK